MPLRTERVVVLGSISGSGDWSRGQTYVGGAGGGASWIGLVIMGAIFVLMGVMSYGMSTIMSSSSPFFDESGIGEVGCLMGGGMTILGVVLLYFGYRQYRKEEERASTVQPVYPQDQTRQAVQTVEVVKVRCRYCGTLNDVGAPTCISCGARL